MRPGVGMRGHWRTEMTDQHIKGTVSKAKGRIEEGLGKLTGDKQQQAKGKAERLRGSVQQGMGSIHDAVRRN